MTLTLEAFGSASLNDFMVFEFVRENLMTINLFQILEVHKIWI